MEKAKIIQLGVHNLEAIDQGTFVGQALKKLNIIKLRPDTWNSRTMKVPLKVGNKPRKNIKRITVFADDSVASTGGDADADAFESEEAQFEIKTEVDESFTQESSTSNSTDPTTPHTTQSNRAITRLPFTSTKLVEVKSTHSSYPERKSKKKGSKIPRTNFSPKRSWTTKPALQDASDQATHERKSLLQRRSRDGRTFTKKQAANKRRALNETTPTTDRLQSFIAHFKATGRATVELNGGFKKFKYPENEKPRDLSEVEIELMLYETEKASEQIGFQVDLWNQIEKSNLLVDMNEEIKKTVKNGSILLNVKLAKARELILKHKESLMEALEDRKRREDASFMTMHHEMTQRDYRSVMKMFENLENSLSQSESSLSMSSKQTLLTR